MAAEEGLELMLLLSPLFQCLEGSYVLLCAAAELCMLRAHSTNGATSPASCLRTCAQVWRPDVHYLPPSVFKNFDVCLCAHMTRV